MHLLCNHKNPNYSPMYGVKCFPSHTHVQVLYTPLGKASREGHSEVVSLLLEERADVNFRDDVSYV